MNSTPNSLSGYRFAAVAAVGNGQEQSELVELGVVTIDHQAVSSEPLVWLVRPRRTIAPHVTRALRITNGDVAAASHARVIAADVAAVLDGRVLLIHDVRQVATLMAAAFADWAPHRVLDMRKLAAMVFPSVTSQALPGLLAHAGLSVPGVPGRARYEADAVAWLFVAMTAVMDTGMDRLFDTATAYPPGAGW